MELRKVTYAKLQGLDAFIPGIGGLGTTLPPHNKTLNMTMYHDVEAYSLKLVLNEGKLSQREVVVPLTNVQIMEYAPTKNDK